jgi:hypothetical protein
MGPERNPFQSEEGGVGEHCPGLRLLLAAEVESPEVVQPFLALVLLFFAFS